MMRNQATPRITSFVIRFVHEESFSKDEFDTWRGAIRHVQTEQEVTFTQWVEALQFMEKFLPHDVLGGSK
jgi:hypothetical protein